MKVLFVIANHAARYGGPPRAIQAYAAALASVGVEVRTISTNQDGKERLDVPIGQAIRQEHGDTLYVHKAGFGKQRPWSPSLARAIKKHVAWADAVHCSSLYLPHNFYTYMACRRQGKPYFVQPHGALEVYQRGFSRRSKAAYDILFGRRYIADAASMHYTADSERSAAETVTGVRRSFVAPIPVQVPAKAADISSRRVLFYGRVSQKKRLDVLVDAWPRVISRHPDALLRIVGPIDPDQARVVRRALLLPGVESLGTVTGDRQTDVLLTSSLFVLPSENENFGIAVAEAMAHGIPVLISKHVALSSMVTNAGAGRVMDNLDAYAWADAISEALSDPSWMMSAGQSGRATVGRALSLHAIGAMLAENLR
jgi:glycosyltransferase involved in cell wall biosynthesis